MTAELPAAGAAAAANAVSRVATLASNACNSSGVEGAVPMMLEVSESSHDEEGKRGRFLTERDGGVLKLIRQGSEA